MRARTLQQTAQEVMRIAQATAIAAIGLRGTRAEDAMRRARRAETVRIERERWDAICRAARATRFDAVRDDERTIEEDDMDRASDRCDHASVECGAVPDDAREGE